VFPGPATAGEILVYPGNAPGGTIYHAVISPSDNHNRVIVDYVSVGGTAKVDPVYVAAGVLQIGEFIRRIEGEGGGARTIALLEEYRGLLPKAGNGEIGLESLQDHLIKLDYYSG
jgi:hypothetical protein